jgi:hypothetical protein
MNFCESGNGVPAIVSEKCQSFVLCMRKQSPVIGPPQCVWIWERKYVPAPQNPSRAMYAMFPISETPVALQYTTRALTNRFCNSITHAATFEPLFKASLWFLR